MNKIRIALISWIFLFLAVPWFAFSEYTEPVAGFPPWALFAFVFTLIYPLVLFFLFNKYWHTFANGDREQ